MLAIWRVHGIDVLLREAWENGVVLFGASAGMICWFEARRHRLVRAAARGDGLLGFLPGSACPHYDGEELRRPRYRELIDGGLSRRASPPTTVSACTTWARSFAEIVTCRPGATAYRVTAGGEEQLPTRELG